MSLLYCRAQRCGFENDGCPKSTAGQILFRHGDANGALRAADRLLALLDFLGAPPNEKVADRLIDRQTDRQIDR